MHATSVTHVNHTRDTSGLSTYNATLTCYKYAYFIFVCWVSDDHIWTILPQTV
jgi:hypothetical protein